tara:strand:+ start:4387 stop:7734 length:3348 start_codon:yes stop_codon:yes gene_type:complete
MIKKTLHNYRVSKIKSQLAYDSLLLAIFYCIMIIIFTLSEIIFYHSTNIRYKFFTILTVTPITLIAFIILKSFINLFKINDNMSDEELSKELGRKIPKLSDQILNSLQLSKIQFENKLRKSLSRQAIEDTERLMQKEDLKNLIPKIPYYKLVSFIIIIITTLLLATLIEGSANSLNRIYSYNQLFDPPTPFKIKANQSLISEYPSGSDVSIFFEIDSPEYPTDIMLHWISNNQHDSLKILSENGIYRYTFNNLQSSHVYWASHKSEKYFSAWDTVGTMAKQITIIKRPQIEDIKFKVQPPAYANLRYQEFNSSVAQINALKGSKLTSEVRSDQLLSSCEIIRDNKDTLKLNKKGNKWVTDLELNNKESIEIAIYNNRNLKNEIPLLYKIKILNDLNPEIYMIEPNQKNFEINDQSQINLSFKTNDDYGLDRSWIEYNISKSNSIDSDSTNYSILINDYPNLKKYQEFYVWDISQYNLYPGDQINFRVAVRDNSPNQSVARTDYYHAIYPSFEDIFTDLENREDEINDMSYEVLSQIESLDEIIEDIELDLLKASNIDWEQQQKAEESLKQMEEIFNNIENMQNAIERLQNQAEKGNKVDDKLVQKFEKFQDMLESIMTPELMEALQKMQEALNSMDIKDMLEAANNLDYNLDQFEQQIDRFIEMFELAIAEQKLNELVESLEIMTKKQESIKNQFNNSDDLSNLQSMQSNQNEKFEKLQDTMGETKQSIEKFSEQATKAIEELMMSKENQNTKKSMKLAEEKISDGDMTAINEISESKDTLQDMYNMAKSIKEDFEEEEINEMIEVFYTAIRNILKLSEYQENLSLNFENIRSSSPSLRPLTVEQFIISKQFIKFIDQLMNLSTKTFYITPDINSKIGYCKKNIDNSIINLEQRKIRTAQSDQNKILSSMNEIAFLLINAMDEMQNSGSPSGLESYMEDLQKIGEGQSQINMGTMQLGQMGMMSQQEMMKRLESQQKALKQQLEEILKDCSGGKEQGGKEHGGLSKAAEDMDDIIRDFQQNKVSKETEKKQQKILSRLLDSQKSLKEREFSEKRKSEVAEETKNYSSPLNMPNNLGNNNLLFIDAMEEALEQNYSNEYKEMFRKYYRDLQKNESK